MAKLTKSQVALLIAVSQATLSGSYVYAGGKEQDALLKAGLVEVNGAIANEAGETATRTTDEGNRLAAEYQTDQDVADIDGVDGDTIGENHAANLAAETDARLAQNKIAERPSFAIAANIEMPITTRTSARQSLYPFDDLEVGQSFFVPATEDKPNPAKSLASTVTSANDRYAEEIEGEFEVRGGKEVPKKHYHRRFAVRPVENGAPWGPEHEGKAGAGVWRVA